MRSRRSSAILYLAIQWTSAPPTRLGQGPKASHAAGEGVDEIAEALVGVAEVVVRHLEHVFVGAGNLPFGICKTAFDDVWRVCAAVDEPAAKLIQVWRQEEDVDVADEYMFKVTNDDLGHAYKRLCDLIDALSGRM